LTENLKKTGFFSPLRLLIRLETRNRFPSALALVGFGVGMISGLVIYWYTSKAFAPAFKNSLSPYASTYFVYILVGELSLLIQLGILEDLTGKLRRLVAEGTLESLLTLPFRPASIILLLSLPSIPLNAVHVIVTIVAAKLIFGFEMGLLPLLGALMLQLAALPLFLGLGLLASAFLVRFGRGDKVVMFIANAGAILGGAYFPVSVFPESIQKLGAMLSPINLLLESTRSVLVHGLSDPVFYKSGLALLGIGMILMPLGHFILSRSFEYARKRGSPLLFTT